MREVVRPGIGKDLGYGVLAGDPERVRPAVITLLYQGRQRQPITFDALSYMAIGRSTRALHLGLVMIDPPIERKGFRVCCMDSPTCWHLCARG
jgi:hypothetical protein